MIPSNITKEHLEKAIKEIDENGVDPGAHSSTYDMVFNNKRYPPKLVVSLANKYANGQILPRDSFKGGQDQPAFQLLEKLGFKIENKETTMKLDLKDIKGEFAQWLLKNAPTSYDYYLGKSKDSIVKRLEEIEAFFPNRGLFLLDETNPSDLIDYINFITSIKERKKHVDFLNYDKKNSNGIPKAILGKNNYIKFLDEEFNNINTSSKLPNNQELYNLKISFLKEWPIERLKSMKLEEYTNLDKTSFCYWLEAITTNLGSIWGGSSYKFGIFKRRDLESENYDDKRMSDGEYAWYGKYGNSKEEVFEKIRNNIISIATFSKANNLEEIDKIDLGDGYKWKIAFLYGNYNVINIFKLDVLRKCAQYLGYQGNEKSFSFLNKFIISKKGDKNFYDFSKELWRVCFEENNENNLIDSTDEKYFIERINNSDPNSLNTFFNVLDKLIDDLEIENTENLVFSTGSNQLSFQVGKRYCLNLKKDKFSFIAPENHLIVGVERSLFAEPDVASYYKNASFNTIVENYKAISEAVKFEIERDNNTSPKEYDNNAFRKAVFDKEYRKRFINFESGVVHLKTQNSMNPKHALNTILYGPPGTGKTYNTILKAAEIMENRSITDYQEAKHIFNQHLGNRIEFITFHQNFSYEDFIQGLRPETENDADLTFNKVDGIFKRIADRALNNLKLAEKAPEEVSKDLLFEQALERFIEEVQEKEGNYEINKSTYIFDVEIDAFRYTGENWLKHSNGLRMKFDDLRVFYKNKIKTRQDIKSLEGISGLANQHATYYLLVYERILKYLPKKLEVPNQQIQKQNYVIIIDEINRANISRVFGELITLIEPDKRSHGAIPLKCTLPSGDVFMVPSNLHIIGTMNTADKSIALLDIALRRRFEFEAMYPKYEIDGEAISDKEILEKINKKIIELKGHDFQIGHAYFMGNNNNLTNRMNKKVIPLLMEYFMNDDKEVRNILTSAGLELEENAWPLRITGIRA